MTARLDFTLAISLIILKYECQMTLYSWELHLPNLIFEEIKMCRSNFIAGVIAVNLPAIPSISATLKTQYLRASPSGIFSLDIDFLPRIFLVKLNLLISKRILFSLVNYFISATVMLNPSSARASSGSSSENITPFNLNTSRLTSVSNSSANLID